MSVNIYKRQRKHASTDEGNLSQLDEEKNTEDCPHPALLNHVIIERIFENLDEDDFRTCRLVCQKWKSVGERSFKNKVRLRLHFQFEFEDNNGEGGDLVQDEIDAKFTAPRNLAQFFQMSQTEVPFTAVRFVGWVPWPPAELCNLFSTEGRFITDLKLEKVTLKSENYTTENTNYLKSYDLTAILGGIKNLKRLVLIRDYHRDYTRWIVSFEKLENIAHIYLDACSIELKTNALIISPTDLTLEDVSFFRDNKPLEKIHLNEIVNFEAMGQLSLGVSRFEKSTKISLDVSGRVTLKEAYFFNTDLLNLEESGWIVDKLNCSFSPFVKPTKMIIKQLEISNCDCVFKMLAISLEGLSLRLVNIVESIEPSLWNISFPHLKRLELSQSNVIEGCLPYLTRYCHNLEDLHLVSSDAENEEQQEVTIIAMRMIPLTVKSLTLMGQFEFVDEALDSVRTEELDYQLDSILPMLRLLELKFFNLWLPYMSPVNPVVKALFETSIPRVELGLFNSKAFGFMKKKYTFDSIDKESSRRVVVVNGRGSTITITVKNHLVRGRSAYMV